MLKNPFVSVASILSFVLSFSLSSPSYGGNTSSGLSKKREEVVQSIPLSQQVIQRARLHPKDSETDCPFLRIPPNITGLIFCHLDPKDEGNARLVCKNWHQEADKGRKIFANWFKNNLWTLSSESLSYHAINRPSHIFILVNALNPLSLPEERTSLRGSVKEIIKGNSALQARLQHVIDRTHFDLSSDKFKFLASNPENHPQLHHHFKALWLLSQCEEEDGANKKRLALLEKTLNTFFYNEEPLKEKGVLKKDYILTTG